MSDQEKNEALESAIKELDDNHLLCRDFGHRWSLQSYLSRLVETLAERHVHVVERKVRCTVCRCIRTEQIRRSDGVMIRRLYDYPEGYTFKPGVANQGGMAKAPFRMEWVRRTGVPEEEDE